MKITYISASAVPSQAANSVHVMKMAAALAAAGHDVSLLTPEHNRKDPAPVRENIFAYYGVPETFSHKNIPYLNMRFLKYRSAYWMTGVMLVLQKPDVVYTRSLSAADIATFLGFKVIFERHDAFETVSEADLKVFRRLIKKSNLLKLVVISQSLKEEMTRKFGMDQGRIIVAHDGADAFQSVKPALANDPGKVKIGYTGHLYQGRGIDVIGQVSESLPDCEFHIVGGTADDAAFWKDQFKLRQNIIFHGHVPPAAVPSYIASFDILLAPYQQKVSVHGNKGDTSRWMSPLKIFEYMSAGKPIVCSDIPVLREVLKDRENAFLCASADANAWAEAIRYLIAHPEKASEIAGNAYADFCSRYTWQKRAEYIMSRIG